jgi:hypothetical protein
VYKNPSEDIAGEFWPDAAHEANSEPHVLGCAAHLALSEHRSAPDDQQSRGGSRNAGDGGAAAAALLRTRKQWAR